MSDAEQPKKPIPPPIKRIRDVRQAEIRDMMTARFGEAHVTDTAIKALFGAAYGCAYAAGVSPEEMHALVDVLSDGIAGHPRDMEQSIGVLGTSLLLFAAVQGVSADECELFQIFRTKTEHQNSPPEKTDDQAG